MADPPIAELEANLASVRETKADPVALIDAINAVAWTLRNVEVPRANVLASEARELAIEHGYTLGQARATRTLAMAIVDEDGLGKIFPLAEEARHLFDETDDAAGRAGSRDFLATLHEVVGDLTGGLTWALDALAIARDLDDPTRIGYALSSVGGILAASGEVDTAVGHLREALGHFEGLGDLGGVGNISTRLSKVLLGAGRFDEARTYVDRCLDVARRTDNEFLRCSGTSALAELAEKRGELEEAERLYRAALDGPWSTPLARNAVGSEAQVALGRVLMKRGSLAEAEHELVDAVNRIGAGRVFIVTKALAHEALADVLERANKLEKAIAHLRAAQALRNRMAQTDARNKLAQVEARAAMVAAEKDAEINRLRFVELHGMQSKLIEAKKMALLGTLAAGTAHELNTPLGVLRSNSDLATSAIERLLTLVDADGEIGAQATKIASVLASCRDTTNAAMVRISEIARSFGRFTELDRAERRAFDVREGLNAALALLEPTMPEAITVERRFEAVPMIQAWPREVNHVFLTVVQNAAQAITGAGVVAVETRATETDVLVHVRDTGRGMSAEQVARLFDVAWSEDGNRTSMRLGLSAAYTTLQQHGGAIDVESEVGEGTTVTLRFPLATP